jgi:hypothetical protein
LNVYISRQGAKNAKREFRITPREIRAAFSFHMTPLLPEEGWRQSPPGWREEPLAGLVVLPSAIRHQSGRVLSERIELLDP